MNKNKLSVVLATYNEEANIAKCLVSVRNLADEIIVMDGQSQDKTQEIAAANGAKVYETVNRPMFHANKQMAIDKARQQWILLLDADEILDAELQNEIKRLLSGHPAFNVYQIRRKNIFLGRWLKKGGQYPDPVIRLFKKGSAFLPQKSVHEQMSTAEKVGKLQGHLIHNLAPVFAKYITNANRYTTLTAEELFSKNVRITLYNDLKYIMVVPFLTFVSQYFRHKGFMDGYEGFIFALFSGLHWTLAYFKLWEKYIQVK